MIKHNLCSKLSADLLWFCKHNSTIRMIGDIFEIFIPSELCMNLIAFWLMFAKAGFSNSYLINLLVAHIVVISTLIGEASLIAFGYVFVVRPIKHAFKRYKVNVRDAYMQKKIQQNN